MDELHNDSLTSKEKYDLKKKEKEHIFLKNLYN